MIEIVEVGGSKLDERNNSLTIQVKRLAGESKQDQADLGYVKVWGPWGECGIPDVGTQALYVEGIGIIGFNCPGIAAVFGAMKIGDKAIFCGEVARTFWKKETREVTTLVRTDDEKDAYCTLNGTAEKYQVAIKGCAQEISETGHKLMEGGSYLELQSGVATLNGGPVRLGPNPVAPVATSPGPVAGVTGSTIPSTSVIS